MRKETTSPYAKLSTKKHGVIEYEPRLRIFGVGIEEYALYIAITISHLAVAGIEYLA